MGKLFISFLGTGKYASCLYKLNDNIYNTDFIQETLISSYCKDWHEENERIRIFYTKETQNSPQDGILSNYSRLNEKLQKFKNVQFVLIKSGKTEDELWEVFNIVNAEIKEGDEIYLDITHAFRFIPMLSCYLLNFAKIQKNITIKHINYGAYDARDENNIAPVYELSLFDHLFDWSIALDSFNVSGKADKINNILKRKKINAIKDESDDARYDIELSKLFENIDGFSQSLHLCHQSNIHKSIEYIQKNIVQNDSLDNNPRYQIQSSLLKDIKDTFYKFPTDASNADMYLAKWCIEHNLYQQAITITQQTFLSFMQKFLNDNGFKFSDSNNVLLKQHEVESKINGAISSYCNKDNESDDTLINSIKKILVKLNNNDILKSYKELKDIRNIVNHFNESDYKISTMQHNISKYINDITNFLANLEND